MRNISPKKKAAIVYSTLLERYTQAETPLIHNSAWQLLIATILSAQTTDARVNLTTPQLFQKYPSLESLALADEWEVYEFIKTIGLAKVKSSYIIETARILVREYNSIVPHEMSQLLKLKGVGRKVANVLLGNWFEINDGFTVDTHVQRVTQRLGITENKNPFKIEKDLMQIFPKDDWNKTSLRLIFFGREICKAKKPLCGSCPFQEICPSAFIY